jgi:hypothetical protein
VGDSAPSNTSVPLPEPSYLCENKRIAPLAVMSAPNVTCTPSGIHTARS